MSDETLLVMPWESLIGRRLGVVRAFRAQDRLFFLSAEINPPSGKLLTFQLEAATEIGDEFFPSFTTEEDRLTRGRQVDFELDLDAVVCSARADMMIQIVDGIESHAFERLSLYLSGGAALNLASEWITPCEQYMTLSLVERAWQGAVSG